MKKFIKEIIILFIQLLVFYILPLFAGPTDMMGLVLLIILATLLLSIIIGSISIYYNESALVHSLWYLVVSAVGLFIGTIIYKLTCKNYKGVRNEK